MDKITSNKKIKKLNTKQVTTRYVFFGGGEFSFVRPSPLAGGGGIGKKGRGAGWEVHFRFADAGTNHEGGTFYLGGDIFSFINPP